MERGVYWHLPFVHAPLFIIPSLSPHPFNFLPPPTQGEFCYELVGEATLPAPSLEAKGVIPLEGPLSYDLVVPWSNQPVRHLQGDQSVNPPVCLSAVQSGFVLRTL
jgi:hypothetical protein